MDQALGRRISIDCGARVLSFRIVWYGVLHWHSMFQEHHLVPMLIALTPFCSHQMRPMLDSPDGKYVSGGWEIGWSEEVLVGVVNLLCPQVAVASLGCPPGHQLSDRR